MEYTLIAHLPTGRKSCPLPEGEITIGRDPPCEMLLPGDWVGRRHATICRQGDLLRIEDLHSKNGTYVNNQRIVAPRALAPGDIITIGTHALHIDHDDAATGSGPMPTPELDWATVSTLPPAPRDEGVLGRIFDLGTFLVRRGDREEMCEWALDKARELVGCDLACLFLQGDAGLAEVSRRCAGTLDREPTFSHTLLELAIHDRGPVLLKENLPPTFSIRRQKIRSAIVLPLFDDERLLGVLYLDSRDHARIYTEQDVRRVELLAAALALKLANSDLLAEQEQAERIQQSLLPRSLFVPSGYEVFARLEPCTRVAGDFYDVLPLARDRCAVLLGDVCGKGSGAALLMASILAMFRALAHQTNGALEIVELLDDRLGGCLDEMNYATLFVGVLDPGRHVLSYVNAGHGSALLVNEDGSFTELTASGTPLGMRLGVPYESRTVEFPRGSMLCTWTDGFPEAHRADVEPCSFFGHDRVTATLVESRRAPLDQTAHSLFDRVDAFQEGTQAHDDRTLLLLRRSP